MKNEFFIQYSSESVKKRIHLSNQNFTSIDVGLRINESTVDFLISFLKTAFKFPIYIALEDLIYVNEGVEEILKENKIDSTCENTGNKWVICKVESAQQLMVVTDLIVNIVNLGLNVFVFHGENLTKSELFPINKCNEPIKFVPLDLNKIYSIIAVYEVGLTIITKEESINTPTKLLEYTPSNYHLDLTNSHI